MSSILVQSRAFRQKMKSAFIPTALALLLAACSTPKVNVSETLKQEAYANSEFYINKIDQAVKPEEQQTYRLLAVRKLIEENKAIEAQNTFSELNVALLDELQKTEYNLLNAQLQALQGNTNVSLRLLKQLNVAQLSRSQQLRFYQTEVKVWESQRDVVEIVRSRSLIDQFLTNSKARQENNDSIWTTLRQANKGMLEQASARTGEANVAGWLELINRYNANMVNPSLLPAAVEEWKQLYPSHSANQLMPSELQNLANFQQTQLNGVALLLPLSGDAQVLGEIIKKGFDDAKGDNPLPVKVYDTDSADVESLITQAKVDGAQTIIGPLLKNRVDELLISPQIQDMNVLALNSTPNVRPVARVCYYGLSPEAEARSAAERLFHDGISYAAVAAPQTDFGQRSADAFTQRWRELTARDADVRYYNQPLDSVVALQNNGIGSGSALYVLGTAEELLEIKQGIDNSPLANQFPIYTSSRSHSTNNSDEFRVSMEGVKFSEIPLLAQVDSAEFKKADLLAQGDFSMMRLYAMGSDSWVIANKFNEFRQIAGFKISGLTGTLSAGTHCNIERQMTWLQYRNGAITATN